MLYLVDLTWYFALFVFFPLIAWRWRFPNVLNTLCAISLITAVVIGGVVGDRIDKGLIYAGKLSLILLVFWPLFRANARSVHLYLLGATAMVCANACLISLAAYGNLPTASLTGGGRWQTVLSSCGAMGLPAVVVFSYWLLRNVSIKPTLSATVLAVIGLAVAIASGSRGVMVLCATPIAMLLVLVVLPRRVPVSVMHVALLLGGVFVLVQVPPDASLIESWIPTRVNTFALALRDNPGQVAESDPERVRLMELATDGIRDHPVLGSGLLSITLPSPTGEPAVVHNRYLSAWAETGLLGFLGLCGITFFWLRMLPVAIGGIRANDPICRFKCVWSIAVLLQFAVFGFFFPMGVQIGDWGFFITAETILTTTIEDRANREASALVGVPVATRPYTPQWPAYVNTVRPRSTYTRKISQ